MGASVPVYDRIGGGYAGGRRTNPRITVVLTTALGDTDSVINVAEGTGSHEPGNRLVVAADPLPVMLAQRQPALAENLIRAG
jgi:hypothetical protein